MRKKVRKVRSLFIPTIAIALVVIGLPYITFGTHPIYTTIYTYIGVMSFLILIRSKDSWFFETNQTFDKVITIMMWIIAIPTFIFLGLSGIIILGITWIISKITSNRKLVMKTIYALAYNIAKTIAFIFGINVDVVDEPTKDQCIFIANHCSKWDDLFNPLFAVIPWMVVFAQEVKRLPLVQPFLKFFGIPINRKDMRSRKEVSKEMLLAIEEGVNIVIYPEGKRLIVEEDRKKQKIILPFEVGAFNLSKKTGRPIQPVVLSWTFLFQPRSGQWWVSPRKIMMIFLPPVYCGESEQPEEFADRVHDLMEAALRESIDEEYKKPFLAEES